MTELAGHIRRWQPARHIWPIVAAALLGLTVAVTAWFAVAIWEKRLARAKFTAVASDYATVLQNGLNDYLSKLVALRAFYDASLEVDPQEFKIFTDQITRGYEETMRLVWCPRVTREEREAFERKARESGLPGYTIRTWAPSDPLEISPPRDEYFPILYSSVASNRKATFGVDLNSESVRREAIKRAQRVKVSSQCFRSTSKAFPTAP
jgi:CHASE1-domain containing sensor protein